MAIRTYNLEFCEKQDCFHYGDGTEKRSSDWYLLKANMARDKCEEFVRNIYEKYGYRYKLTLSEVKTEFYKYESRSIACTPKCA